MLLSGVEELREDWKLASRSRRLRRWSSAMIRVTDVRYVRDYVVWL